MQAALRVTTRVQPGGKIEVSDVHLPAGKSVDVIVLFPESDDSTRRSIVDVLAESPGHLTFQTAEDVDAYLRQERDAWER